MGSAFTQRQFGSNGNVFDETPSGTINGTNDVFTTGVDFISGSLRVYKNGVRLEEGASNDFLVTGTDEFTMATAPATGTKLLVDYQTAGNASGNADTLDGKDASAFLLASAFDDQTGSGYIILGNMQICWVTDDITFTALNTDTYWGVNWPRAFSATPVATASVKTGWSGTASVEFEGLSTTTMSGYARIAAGTVSRSGTVHAIGIGAA